MRVREIEAGRARKNNGIIEISAGSQAQGVAYHAQRLGVAATIVMPKGTPFTKITRTQGPMHALFLKAIPSAMPNPMPTKSRTKKGRFCTSIRGYAHHRRIRNHRTGNAG